LAQWEPLALLLASLRGRAVEGLGDVMLLAVDGADPHGRGGHLGLVPRDAKDVELSVCLKRVFVRVVPNVQRFGTNARMLFQRIHFAIPREVRSNTARATAFTDNGMNMDTEALLSIIHRHQFPPEHRCSRDKLLVLCVSLPRMCSLPLPRMCSLTHTHTHRCSSTSTQSCRGTDPCWATLASHSVRHSSQGECWSWMSFRLGPSPYASVTVDVREALCSTTSRRSAAATRRTCPCPSRPSRRCQKMRMRREYWLSRTT
jgi:hypothetical protein